MNDTELHPIAEKVLFDADKRAIDPFTIIMIISLIIELVKLFQSCNKTAKDVKEMLDGDKFSSAELGILRRRITKIVGDRKSLSLHKKFHKLFVTNCQKLSQKEIEDAFKCVENHY